jgi:hypothetical protein
VALLVSRRTAAAVANNTSTISLANIHRNRHRYVMALQHCRRIYTTVGHRRLGSSSHLAIASRHGAAGTCTRWQLVVFRCGDFDLDLFFRFVLRRDPVYSTLWFGDDGLCCLGCFPN